MTFQKTVDDTEELLRKYVAVSKGPPAFNPEGIPARRRFLARRVKLLKNLLRWRKFTGEQYGVGLLIARVTDDCILGIAENGWDVGGEEVAKSVSVLSFEGKCRGSMTPTTPHRSLISYRTTWLPPNYGRSWSFDFLYLHSTRPNSLYLIKVGFLVHFPDLSLLT